MTNWQKRFIIGVNIATLFLYLDVSFLIFIRSVNSSGIYQTMHMKCLTYLAWTLCYAFVWMCQGVVYMVFKHATRAKKHDEEHYA